MRSATASLRADPEQIAMLDRINAESAHSAGKRPLRAPQIQAPILTTAYSMIKVRLMKIAIRLYLILIFV